MDGCGSPTQEAGPALDDQPMNLAVPKQGLVKQVRREWLVHEDSALAYRLQEKEIEMHYGKNREERKIVRMDLQQAKSLQQEDDLGSATTIGSYVDNLLLQELEDERVAKELQEQLEREEALHNRILEQADKELAKKLQENESRHAKRKSKRGESFDQPRGTHGFHHATSVGKKNLASCYEDTLTRATRNMSLDGATAGRTSEESSPTDGIMDSTVEIQPEDSPHNVMAEDTLLDQHERRRFQEIKDEKLALTMQEEEITKTGQYYKDQQLAIEAQDRELAKLLQEKERLRAKKARQKARFESNKSKGAEASEDDSQFERPICEREGGRHALRRGNSYFDSRAATTDGKDVDEMMTGSRSRSAFSARSRSCDEGFKKHSLQRVPISPTDDLPNIAMALDPTYNQELETIHRKSLDFPGASSSASQCGLHTRSLPIQADISDDEYGADEHAVPPYMPIQGQKRQAIDKRRKKENCKQQ